MHPKIMTRIPITGLVWFVCAYSYYGLNMVAPPDLFSNPTVSWIWGFALEFPAYTAGGFLMRSSVGRKGATVGGLGLAGVLLLGFSFEEYLGETGVLINQILYYPARMGVACAFGVIYIWSIELYPSSIRQTAMGLNSLLARIGTMISPWLDVLSFQVRMTLVAAPLLVVAVLAAIFLPETRGNYLPGRVRDMVGAEDA